MVDIGLIPVTKHTLRVLQTGPHAGHKRRGLRTLVVVGRRARTQRLGAGPATVSRCARTAAARRRTTLAY